MKLRTQSTGDKRKVATGQSNIYGRNILRRNTDDNTRGSDGTYHTTLQGGPEIVVDSTHGEWTHVTNHEGLLVHHSPVLVMKFRTALWIHTRRTVIIRNLVKVPKPIRKKRLRDKGK